MTKKQLEEKLKGKDAHIEGLKDKIHRLENQVSDLDSSNRFLQGLIKDAKIADWQKRFIVASDEIERLKERIEEIMVEHSRDTEGLRETIINMARRLG